MDTRKELKEIEKEIKELIFNLNNTTGEEFINHDQKLDELMNRKRNIIAKLYPFESEVKDEKS